MTADEIISVVADELNLSNPEAISRIGKELNIRYKQVTSSIGLITSRRVTVSQSATIGDRTITFTGVERLDTVYYTLVGTNNIPKNKILDEVTNDEMLDLNPGPGTGFPRKYCINTFSPTSVTVTVDAIPTDPVYTLYASGLAGVGSLTGTASPQFPESFHDILIYGIKADEFIRKEKAQLAADAETKFQNRLSDLRMFIAKSAYSDIHRGKHAKSEDWWDYNRNT